MRGNLDGRDRKFGKKHFRETQISLKRSYGNHENLGNPIEPAMA